MMIQTDLSQSKSPTYMPRDEERDKGNMKNRKYRLPVIMFQSFEKIEDN